MAIAATLTTSATTSDSVRGIDVCRAGGLMGAAVSYQVKYGPGVTTGNFSVNLEAGKSDGGTVTYGTVATVDQTNVNKPAVITVGPDLHYRFVHSSGVDTRVLFG